MSDSNKLSGPKIDTDIFKVLVQKYLPFIPMFIAMGILFLALSYLYSKVAVKSYEITASVLIQDQKKGMDESKMLEALDVFKGKKIVENEVEVLHSRSLMRQVVKNLGLYAVINEDQKIRTVDVYSDAPFYIRVKDLDKLVPADNVPFTYNAEKRLVNIQGKEYPLNQWVNTSWGELSFLSNNNYIPANSGYAYSFSLLNIKSVEERLIKSLEVNTLNKLASVVTLKLIDTDPKRGEDILNELLSLYTKAEVEDKNILAGNILASVENRLRYVVGQLDSVENAIQRFRSTEGVIDIGQQGKLYLENVGQYDKQLQDVNIRIAVLDEVDKYISSKNVSTAVMPSALGVEDPSLSQMLTKLNDTQSEYDKLRKTTAENSPLIVGVKEQLDKLRPAIQDMVVNQKRNLQIAKDNLSRSSEKYSTMLGTIPLKEKQLVEISRQQSIKNEIYSYLLQRREEAALSYATAKADSKIVDPAESTAKHVSPKMSIIYLAALILATVFTIILISLKENFNKSILFRKEIEEVTKVPVIGEIIHVKSPDAVVYQDKDKSFIVEQFRALRNGLTMGTGRDRNKVIFVTSAQEKEGKSFISLNLAISLAALSKKTVLVDIDVDNQKITHKAGLEGKFGITDFIYRGAKINEIIHQSELHPNLSVIPLGNKDASGVEISVSEAINGLFEELRNKYDYIVISSGAFTINANAQAIAQYADVSVFVIRHGKTPKSSVVMLANEGKLDNLKQAHIVFNDVRKRGWLKGSYGYGYGYGYELKQSV